jgi:hypothetical protein
MGFATAGEAQGSPPGEQHIGRDLAMLQHQAQQLAACLRGGLALLRERQLLDQQLAALRRRQDLAQPLALARLAERLGQRPAHILRQAQRLEIGLLPGQGEGAQREGIACLAIRRIGHGGDRRGQRPRLVRQHRGKGRGLVRRPRRNQLLQPGRVQLGREVRPLRVVAQHQHRRLCIAAGGHQRRVQLLVAALPGLQLDRARRQPVRQQPGQVLVAAHPLGQILRRGRAVALPFAQHPVDQPRLLRSRQLAEVAVALQRLGRGLGAVIFPEAQPVVLDLVTDPFVDLARPRRRHRRPRPLHCRGKARLPRTGGLRLALPATQRRQAHALPSRTSRRETRHSGRSS